MSACVVAVIATLRRPRELARLLASLEGVETAVVCNNKADAEVRAVCERAPVPTVCRDVPENLGCGGGLRLAEEEALARFCDRLTHLLVLDDDVELEPDTVRRLVEVMEQEKANAVYPLVIAENGCVGWTPGLSDRAKRRLAEDAPTPAEYRSRLGSSVEEFTWAQGICLLIRRAAIDECGLHRADFWVRGEDLDFSLRLTQRGRGIFAPAIVVKHLPPAASPAASRRAEYFRHAAMIQNIAYLGFRQVHGKRIAKSLAGAVRHFVGLWGLASFPDLLVAFWRGGVLAQPAGQGNGRTFQQRFNEVIQ